MPTPTETPRQKAERLVREAVAQVARDHSPAAYDWLDVVKLNLATFYEHHADFKAHYQRIVLSAGTAHVHE